MKHIFVLVAIIGPSFAFAANFPTGSYHCEVRVDGGFLLKTEVEISAVNFSGVDVPFVSIEQNTAKADGTTAFSGRARGFATLIEREEGIGLNLGRDGLVFRNGVLLDPYDFETPCQKL